MVKYHSIDNKFFILYESSSKRKRDSAFVKFIIICRGFQNFPNNVQRSGLVPVSKRSITEQLDELFTPEIRVAFKLYYHWINKLLLILKLFRGTVLKCRSGKQWLDFVYRTFLLVLRLIRSLCLWNTGCKYMLSCSFFLQV